MERHVSWVLVPAGTLCRGTPCEAVEDVARRHESYGVRPEWIWKECPRTELFVPAFRIARTPVTNALWTAFATATGSVGPPAGAPEHPVTGVSWRAASTLCSWLADVLGEPVRLPLEVEWERAARGDDAREYPWGDEYETGLANLLDLGAGGPLPVGSLRGGASPFGVLDMAGNVDEWTATEYRPYRGAPEAVPATETWATDPHVTRGGCWFHNRDLARCARRHGVYDPGLAGVGLRLAAGT